MKSFKVLVCFLMNFSPNISMGIEVPDIMYDDIQADIFRIAHYNFLKDLLEKVPSIKDVNFYKVAKPIFKECPCKLRSKKRNDSLDYFIPLEELNSWRSKQGQKAKNNTNCGCRKDGVRNYTDRRDNFSPDYSRLNIHRKNRIRRNIQYAVRNRS